MDRSKKQRKPLNTWLNEELNAETAAKNGDNLFAKIRHGFKTQKDLFGERGRCVDLWLSNQVIEGFTPLTEMEPPWNRKTLYRQMRNALSHSMVFMRGHPAIQEIVLCPEANNSENRMRRGTKKEEKNRYQEAKKEYEEWEANRGQDPTGNTEEMEEPPKPAPLLLTCDCLVFPIDTFKDLLRHWLEFFDTYREDLDVLTGRDLFDDYDDDFEAA